MFKIGDFSKLSQVSVNALRFYDEIRLLKPTYVGSLTGYRYYAANLSKSAKEYSIHRASLDGDECAHRGRFAHD